MVSCTWDDCLSILCSDLSVRLLKIRHAPCWLIKLNLSTEALRYILVAEMNISSVSRLVWISWIDGLVSHDIQITHGPSLFVCAFVWMARLLRLLIYVIILSVSFKCTSSYELANSYPKCQAGNECAPYLIHDRLTRCCLLFRNIVSTVNLDCKLELKNIALSAHNA